jgi:hypothetical protein
MDVFLSHSSANTVEGRRVERTLKAADLSVWLDRSEIRLGALLRAELQQAIMNSRVLVLLWSKAARRSPWVAAEILTAYHLDRFIIPCLLDGASLPQFLSSAVQLDLRRKGRSPLQELVRAVGAAPQQRNEILPVMRGTDAKLEKTIGRLHTSQENELADMRSGDLRAAARKHSSIDKRLTQARKAWRFSHVLLNMAGYHAKNEYLINHWAEVQAGHAPKDRLLDRAQRCFFDTLFIDPNDFSALNGLGSVLIMQHELAAARFFVTRVIGLAKRAGIRYRAAEEDLALIDAMSGGPPDGTDTAN